MARDIKTDLHERAQRGYSLAELLVTMAILMLVTSIMVAAVPSALRAYTDVVDASNAQVMLATTITRLRDELSMANPDEHTMDLNASNELKSFTSLETGYTVSFFSNKQGNLCKKEEATGLGSSSESKPVETPLIPTKKANLGSKANLCATYDSIKYNKTKGVFEVKGLRVVEYTPTESDPGGLIGGNVYAGAGLKDVLEIRVLAAPQ